MFMLQGTAAFLSNVSSPSLQHLPSTTPMAAAATAAWEAAGFSGKTFTPSVKSPLSALIYGHHYSYRAADTQRGLLDVALQKARSRVVAAPRLVVAVCH